MRRIALVLTTALLAAGCGSADDASIRDETAETTASAAPVEPTADFDIDDPAYSLLGEDEDSDNALARRAGERRDFKVPASLLRDLQDGPLAHAAIIRPWMEIDSAADPAYRRLNDGQRALYVMTWADEEILNGGFDQFFTNDTGMLAPDLVAAAERVGAREYAAIFRGALAARDDGADYAPADDRYALLQYRRRTSLAIILGAYVDRHRTEFAFAG